MTAKMLLHIRKLTESFVLLMIVLMTMIISYQVISRFVFNTTPPWIQPLSLLLMVWIGFIGIAIGIQDNSHIKINLFVEKMPKKIQTLLNYTQRVLAVLFGLFMVIEGGKFSLSMLSSSIPGLKVPSAVLYIAVPLAGLLIIVYLICEFLGKWESLSEESEVE
ncbi:TRAP transporter small permease [Cytobacillus gottheilii]|uniref:TRAP transporter small permease n=1 Tax=Cytobacillus gottheilii TaxID=859144 RepID=UPI0009BA1B22|nr:TRAP transporter small permease subunit [Cytobacillus gottheilii]